MAGVKEGALKKMLPKRYKHRGLIAHEICSVISDYKCLTPAMEAYVFNDGTTRDLMCLSGNVPAFFFGKEFNIHVCLWILDSYPTSPPICFVKPTKDTMIVTGQYTDANGEIHLPYLHEWNYPQSDLYGLIQMLTVVFGEEPPICARPPTQTAPADVRQSWESQQLSQPDFLRQTEINSPAEEESHFTLRREDDQCLPQESSC